MHRGLVRPLQQHYQELSSHNIASKSIGTLGPHGPQGPSSSLVPAAGESNYSWKQDVLMVLTALWNQVQNVAQECKFQVDGVPLNPRVSNDVFPGDQPLQLDMEQHPFRTKRGPKAQVDPMSQLSDLEHMVDELTELVQTGQLQCWDFRDCSPIGAASGRPRPDGCKFSPHTWLICR
ncbi:hypothetical protein L0F63_000393 [Massospora cicadina]|nr:hypothetical protein L0F63_000393 [Massospora cicadina]